nr:O-antigen ligase family protein [Micromonospora tarapacensis]
MFGVLLTAAAVAVAGWLVRERLAVAAAFGGGPTAVVLVGFAVLTSVASGIADDYSPAIIGVLVLGLLAWLFATRRWRLSGPAEIWPRISLAMAGALLLWCLAVDVIAGSGVYGSRLPAYAAAGLLLATVWLMSAGTSLSLRAMAYTGLAVLSSLTIPAAIYEASWRACTVGRLEKCSLAGALFRGLHNSENYIAMIATFTLVAAACALRRTELLAASSFCLLIIVATGSRTSYLALAVLGVWLLGAHLLERRRSYPKINFALGVTLVVGAVATATYVTWTATKTTLSNRGNIWSIAREYIAGAEITGVGVSKWSYLRDIGEAPRHFFHSGYVLAIFAGGLVALTLWGLWLATLLRRTAVDGRAFSAKAPLVLLVVCSFTEVVWNPLSVDGLTWIVVLLMLTTSAVPPPAEPVTAVGRVPVVHRPAPPAGPPDVTGRQVGGPSPPTEAFRSVPLRSVDSPE